MARILSLVVAVVTALGGHALLFLAAYYIYASGSSFRGAPIPIFVAPCAVIGVVLIGIAAVTAAWSSLGVIVVGAVQVLVGLIGTFVPPVIAIQGARSPRFLLDRALLSAGPMGQIADLWISVGAALIEGVLLLALGWACARRRRQLVASPTLARVLSVIVLFVGLGPATLLAFHGGVLSERRMLQMFGGPDILGVVLLLVGAVLLAVLMLTTRWSGIGAIIWGGVLALVSLVAAIVPTLLPASSAVGYSNPLSIVVRGLPAAVAETVLTSLWIGAIAVVAVTFLFGGIASVRAGRVGRRRDSYVRPPTGEVPEVEPRFLADRPIEGGTTAGGV